MKNSTVVVRRYPTLQSAAWALNEAGYRAVFTRPKRRLVFVTSQPGMTPVVSADVNRSRYPHPTEIGVERDVVLVDNEWRDVEA